jgi:uncharacterized protein YndB with AHSA1/START domain
MSDPTTKAHSGDAKKTSAKPATSSKEGTGASPAELIDARIKELNDWRGETLARVRALIKEADSEAVEEWKWRGVPVWSHAGILCTGETYRTVVKLTFAKGAALEDPSGLFNSSLEGSTRRAIDIHEGDPIDEEALKALIRAAVTLNVSARAARPVRSEKTRDRPMTKAAAETRSVVIEREIPHPPEKIWRALTQPHLIEEWLMKNDFEPVVDRKFNLRGDWGAVDCQVLEVVPHKTLSYTWAAHGLESVVIWTLTPTSKGTNLRMEQAGFRPGQEQFYQGAKTGWGNFFAKLEQVLARTD